MIAASLLMAAMTTATAGPAPNVLFVTVDTLRADRVGCYGYAPGATPIMDQLARDGVVVEDATVQVPQTRPSHASLLTGRWPFSTDPGQLARPSTHRSPHSPRISRPRLCHRGVHRIVRPLPLVGARSRVRFLRRSLFGRPSRIGPLRAPRAAGLRSGGRRARVAGKTSNAPVLRVAPPLRSPRSVHGTGPVRRPVRKIALRSFCPRGAATHAVSLQALFQLLTSSACLFRRGDVDGSFGCFDGFGKSVGFRKCGPSVSKYAA